MSSSDTDIVSQAHALAASGAIADAMQLLEAASRQGNAYAAAALGDWRLSGTLIRRDLERARHWYGRASELGMSEVESIYIALLANGAGGMARYWQRALDRLKILAKNDPWAKRQCDLIGQMRLTSDGDPTEVMVGGVVSDHPIIRQHRAFMTPEECHYLVDLSASSLQPATVVHPVTGALVQDPIRTARTTSFPFVREDPVLHAINRRIAAATSTSYAQGEPLQILCYAPGEEYKLHSDTLPPGHNQRDDTFLVALTCDYRGGETSFPRLNIHWRGGVGDALHFRSVDDMGAPDKLAWHTGQPVQQGVKFMLSKWIRRGALDISGPPGRPF